MIKGCGLVFKKNREKKTEKVPFDYQTWNIFVDTVGLMKHGEKYRAIHLFDPRTICVEYNYIGVEYTEMLYTLIVNDGVVIGVNFWSPEVEANKGMSCRLINRCLNLQDAMKFINKVIEGKIHGDSI